ncbi:MAG: two-component regulator propeller domain-containing protein [Candidatus Cryptobacteroides sp.]
MTTLSVLSYAQEVAYSVRQPSMEVNAFSQDSDGYVWIATSKGLARFNGSGYKIWYATNDDNGISNDVPLS